MERNKALLYLVVASVLWSIGGIFIKLVDCSPIVISGMRSIIAFMVIFLLTRKKTVPKIKQFTPSKMLFLGVVSYVLLVICFVSATKYTTAANAIMLQFTAPIWVPILAFFFLREKTSKEDWVVIGLIFGGIILFFMGDLQIGNIFGNVLALGAGISMAMMIISMKHQTVDPVILTLLGNLVIGIITMPSILKTDFSSTDIMYLCILGVFQLGVPYVFYTSAIKHVSSIEGIIIPILEPLLNPVWVMIFAGEVPGIWSAVGGILILTVITFRTIRVSKKPSSLSYYKQNAEDVVP